MRPEYNSLFGSEYHYGWLAGLVRKPRGYQPEAFADIDMSTPIVLTILGEDRPGIVESLSEVLARHNGNWNQSSMSSLAGQFAGILLATVPDDHASACISDLEALSARGLQVNVHASETFAPATAMQEFALDLVGNDRHGIVRDITHVLAQHGVNVQELETEVESASMAGGALFRARAWLLAPASVDLDALERELEEIANELMVEIRFDD
jgi:glycine cleavage system regulatory protein